MATPSGIDDRKFRALRAKLDQLSDQVVKIGVFAGTGDGEAVTVAAVHEFGSERAHVPERSFLRRTFHEQKDRFAKAIGNASKRVVAGKLQPEVALGALGVLAATAVKNTIARGPHIPPPLSRETVRRKKSRRPLVDTGQLLNSITWKVGRRGGGIAGV